MAGHSKWSKIKRKKGANDAKRGKVFTKLIREITVAARIGGGDPEGNPRLATAIETARGQNMPTDNIDRAIKKGSGNLDGAGYEEYTYEGYGPGGIAMLVDTLTDNKQRTTAEVRHIFNKYGGSLGEPNSVAWNFDLRGLIQIPSKELSEEKVMEWALEAGADDIQNSDDCYEIYTDPKLLFQVKSDLEKHDSLRIASAALVKEAKNLVNIDADTAVKVLKLVEHLEDNDDVQNVYTNSDISQEILETLMND